MTSDPLDEPAAVARVLRPISIRDEHPAPYPARHRGPYLRHVAARILTAALILVGVLVATVTADATPSLTGPRWQDELQQDAGDQADRAAMRGES